MSDTKIPTRDDEHVDWHATWPGRVVPPVDHARSFRLMSQLSETCHQWFCKQERAITPEQVIKVLNDAGIDFVLMGLYGMSGWMSEERATQVVDVLVRKQHHRKAVKIVQAAFPDLEMRDTAVVTRFHDPQTGKVVLDLMKPMHQLHEAVFQRTLPVGDTHRIPDLEMALACKFGAMVSPYRQRNKKFIDAGDFAGIVERNKDDINRDRLRSLGELAYPGGGDEIIEFLDAILSGKPIQL